jgi:hypothetical protein
LEFTAADVLVIVLDDVPIPILEPILVPLWSDFILGVDGGTMVGGEGEFVVVAVREDEGADEDVDPDPILDVDDM